MTYTEIKGDLVNLALTGSFDVIAHGCNCFCSMKSGIAPQMANAFGCNGYVLEGSEFYGDIGKLGNIDWENGIVNTKLKTFEFGNKYSDDLKELVIINAYTQFEYKSLNNQKPLDYEALTLCLRKINNLFKGKHIGLPQIGCGLAGGDWNIVQKIIKQELKDCKVTVVIYSKH